MALRERPFHAKSVKDELNQHPQQVALVSQTAFHEPAAGVSCGTLAQAGVLLPDGIPITPNGRAAR